MKTLIWFGIAVGIVGFVGSAAAIMGACLAAHSNDSFCNLCRYIRDKFRGDAGGKIARASRECGEVNSVRLPGVTLVSDTKGNLSFRAK